MIEQGGTQAGQEDALRTAQREIEGVREIMTENIERVLERGEHMSLLVDKTGRLGENARDFQGSGHGRSRGGCGGRTSSSWRFWRLVVNLPGLPVRRVRMRIAW